MDIRGDMGPMKGESNEQNVENQMEAKGSRLYRSLQALLGSGDRGYLGLRRDVAGICRV